MLSLHEDLASSAAFHLFVSQSGSHWAISSGWPLMFKRGTDVPVADPTVLFTPEPAVSVVLLTAFPAVPVVLLTALPACAVPFWAVSPAASRVSKALSPLETPQYGVENNVESRTAPTVGHIGMLTYQCRCPSDQLRQPGKRSSSRA